MCDSTLFLRQMPSQNRQYCRILCGTTRSKSQPFKRLATAVMPLRGFWVHVLMNLRNLNYLIATFRVKPSDFTM